MIDSGGIDGSGDLLNSDNFGFEEFDQNSSFMHELAALTDQPISTQPFLNDDNGYGLTSTPARRKFQQVILLASSDASKVSYRGHLGQSLLTALNELHSHSYQSATIRGYSSQNFAQIAPLLTQSPSGVGSRPSTYFRCLCQTR